MRKTTGILGRAACALAIGSALAAPSAPASAPALPAGCSGNSFAFSNPADSAIANGGPSAPPVLSTVQASGAQPYIRDVDLVAAVSHTHSADLDITLTSPDGTVVTVTTDNGGTSDDVFGNAALSTRWDDDAGQPVTDAPLVNGVPSPQLVPEEAMAAFVGEDPNGTWTLSVGDDSAPDNGTLHGWSVEIATLEGTPTLSSTSVSDPAVAAAIPNPGLTSDSLSVTGVGTYLFDADATTDITHAASGDLSVALQSPAATASDLTTNNGASFDDVFGDGAGASDGTVWDDDAGDTTTDPGGGPVTDAEFADDTVETPLVAEEAMGAFIGENPNGSWTLNVNDLFAGGFGGDSGTFNSWSLEVTTISGCVAAPGNQAPDADAGGPYAIDEDDPLTLDATQSTDPDAPGDSIESYSWDVNGDDVFGDAAGPTPTLTAAELEALGVDDGPATHGVRVLVSDGEATDVSPSADLDVSNLAPSLDISGSGPATAGQPQAWSFEADDPSGADDGASFDYAIDWDGDGTTDQSVSASSSAQVIHTYPAEGDLVIRATATDKDGGESAVATEAVTVLAAPTSPDPGPPGGDPAPGPCSNPISGTSKGDDIVGTDGPDSIDGGRGRDRIQGLGGDDCVQGAGGRDRIDAGEGDDFVDVRRGGRDRAKCGPGEDTVIASRRDRVRGCENVNP